MLKFSIPSLKSEVLNFNISFSGKRLSVSTTQGAVATHCVTVSIQAHSYKPLFSIIVIETNYTSVVFNRLFYVCLCYI